jgi:hypothetical protein
MQHIIWGGFPGVHNKLAVVFESRVNKFKPLLLFEVEGLKSYMVCWLGKPTLQFRDWVIRELVEAFLNLGIKDGHLGQ